MMAKRPVVPEDALRHWSECIKRCKYLLLVTTHEGTTNCGETEARTGW